VRNDNACVSTNTLEGDLTLLALLEIEIVYWAAYLISSD